MKGKCLFFLALLMQMPLLAQNDTVISNSSSDTVPAIDRRGHYIEAVFPNDDTMKNTWIQYGTLLNQMDLSR